MSKRLSIIERENKKLIEDGLVCLDMMHDILYSIKQEYNSEESVCNRYNISKEDFRNFLVTCSCLVNSEEVKERNLTLVTELGFSTSIVNALLRNKIQFVYQIELYTYKDLKRFRMIGVTSAIEIVEVLESKFNIKLQGYEDYLKDKQKLMSGKY